MNDIIALIACLAPYLSSTALSHLSRLIMALLCIPGRVTTLGLSRWCETGGSCRTLQRWYQMPLDWATLLWAVVRQHLVQADGVYLLAGDDVVISKAGQHTHGVGRFYSSLAGRPIASLSFFALSLIDVAARRAYPLQVEQHLPVSKAAQPAIPPAAKRPCGRPKGSKNYAKATPLLSAELTLLEQMLRAITTRIAPLAVRHLVLDGYFGTAPATFMVRRCDLHLISKLHHNAALYFPYSGPKPRRGPTPRYGAKLAYAALPAAALRQTVIDGRYRLDTCQLTLLHKDFQIEFNFCDAKQYWGLEDFMNVSPTAVTNAVNLAFLMVNLSLCLLRSFRQHQPDFSILDLKAHYRAQRYLHETIKLFPVSPDPDLISKIERNMLTLGAIHASQHLQAAA